MAKMHNSFIEFDEKLRLSDYQEEEVRNSRDANRDAVRSWMKDNDNGAVEFCMQGSYPMNTTVAPLEGEEYDIDDGVYLSEYKDTEMCEWPKCEAVHSWIESATKGRTKKEPIDKDACIRVSYAHGYHVDMPIYIMKDGHAYLARKSSGWEINDAKEFKDWVNERNSGDGQLKRIIRYLKRWKDCNAIDLKGIAITVLVGEHFQGACGRDDDALRYTVDEICESLGSSFRCVKPLAPYDNLFEAYSSSEADKIVASFKELLSSLEEAHLLGSAHEASKVLRNVFGEAFPVSSDKSSSASSVAVTSAPGILNRDEKFG